MAKSTEYDLELKIGQKNKANKSKPLKKISKQNNDNRKKPQTSDPPSTKITPLWQKVTHTELGWNGSGCRFSLNSVQHIYVFPLTSLILIWLSQICVSFSPPVFCLLASFDLFLTFFLVSRRLQPWGVHLLPMHSLNQAHSSSRHTHSLLS